MALHPPAALVAAMLHPLDGGGLRGWTVHPSTVIGIAALGGLYWWRVHQDARSPSAAQRLSFVAGLAVLFLSLNGPLHDLSDTYLFSAHMVQHLLLTMAVIPLLIAGTPGWMLRPALRVPAVATIARAATRPVACFTTFTATLAIWHIPAVYDLAMRHHAVHIAQHLCFLVSATLMWWPIMSPLPELPRLSFPKQMLYTFLLTLPMALIGVIITYASDVLYPAYQTAPRVWGLSPMADQLVGGLIMWVPGGFVFLAVLTVVFFRWAQRGTDDTAGAQVDWQPTA
ncbi:MAG: cytochrome c oxidase assembly protein [Gemmatimonadaceae bacterium]